MVTGCMAERYGDELAAELPEIDHLAPFGMSLIPAGDWALWAWFVERAG